MGHEKQIRGQKATGLWHMTETDSWAISNRLMGHEIQIRVAISNRFVELVVTSKKHVPLIDPFVTCDI
ncbi:MAG: hypothetical protein EOP48_03480 [Sphingobacteriales bacterium]|nr:MAG: hypothetical protein EOP48_03480 [Sphingobacteriales bacterium]